MTNADQTTEQTSITKEQAETSDRPAEPSYQGRYNLMPSGEIFWQANATNPLPGIPVGRIVKGDTPLAPTAVLTDETGDRAVVQEWLEGHIRTVLAPLFALKETGGDHALSGAAADIGAALYDKMGVVHRADIEAHVPMLTPELRHALRRKHVRMGPILVFLPDLIKPAAVNMRALLYALWNDMPLPAQTLADGRVSVPVDPETADKRFYLAIGYPVFGPKAVRIDMLDRVVTDIYEQAKDWRFQARHAYAEWLGCPIDDLYAVLESMGHRRIQTDGDVTPENAQDVQAAPVIEAPDEQAPAQTPVKPELAWFQLKKGKISERRTGAGERRNSRDTAKTERSSEKRDFQRPKKRPADKKAKNDRATGAKVFSASPKRAPDEDDGNPFAILKTLKN